MLRNSLMPKPKTDSTRTYDPDGYRRRAVAVCLRDPGSSQVLLVSSTIQPDMWVLPGGGVEPREAPESAALREVWEEAGVIGHVICYLGTVDDPHRRERTWVYSVRVSRMLASWVESEQLDRKRQWFDMPEAKKRLALYKPTQIKYLNLCNGGHAAS